MMKVLVKHLSVMASLALATPLWAIGPGGDDAEIVLQQTMKTPDVAYHGHLVVTHWFGEHSKTEESLVNYRPPNFIRWEFLKPDGTVDRIVVSDGSEEQLQMFPTRRTLKGKAAKSVSKQMPLDKEWQLLMQNYKVALVGKEQVAGRRTRILALTPHNEGKPTEFIWVDEQTGVVLAAKRFRPQGTVAIQSRFVEFDLGSLLPQDAFHIDLKDSEEPEAHGFDPDFLSMESFFQKTGRQNPFPGQLPLGFELESADYFTVDGKTVNYFRYTDGLNIISIFDTPKPTRSNAQAMPLPNNRPNVMQINESGHILHGKKNNRYFTLIGDVSEDVLKKVFQSIQ